MLLCRVAFNTCSPAMGARHCAGPHIINVETEDQEVKSSGRGSRREEGLQPVPQLCKGQVCL